MTIASRASRARITGVTEPRIAPPVPARSLVAEYRQAAEDLGIKLMPWQLLAGRYLTALDGKRWRYREVCIVVARQNGKTSLLLPRILMGLRRGERMLHTAQNRAIPRETFLAVARLLNDGEDVEEIRFANGQELIRAKNGGRYTLVAPRPGVRGYSVDTVFVDEVREQRSFDLMAAIRPTLTASKDPQIVFLSNAGSDDSVVLNELQRRGTTTAGSIAYLEWSAKPGRALADVEGWREANPALGVTIQLDTLEDLLLSSTPAEFETEHLCRWVTTMLPRLVDPARWQRAEGVIDGPLRPALGISMDPSGGRAAGVLAWRQVDGRIALTVLADVTGEPIDTDLFGSELREQALRLGVREVGFDSLTDAELARYFKNAKPMTGRLFANACGIFENAINAGQLVWSGADTIGSDLGWTARKALAEGAWTAIKVNDDRPIPAVLAAIRAVMIASGPRPTAPKIL